MNLKELVEIIMYQMPNMQIRIFKCSNDINAYFILLILE